MTPWPEHGLVFRCRGADLVGVVHLASAARGVLVVVGGPQYRAGSHRQFTLLARRLAAAGFPVFRFDSRGHGDSDGARPGFENLEADIDAALDAFAGAVPALRDVVVLGLCDAASAALLHGNLPSRVSGLVLMNPWVTEGQVDAEAMLKHYYVRRLFSRSFWRKLLDGGVRGAHAIGELGGSVLRAVRNRLQRGGAARGGPNRSLPQRMARGLSAFGGQVLLVTSGNDLTAAEFLEVAAREPCWRRLMAAPRLTHVHLADANHTFASARSRALVEDRVIDWMRSW